MNFLLHLTKSIQSNNKLIRLDRETLLQAPVLDDIMVYIIELYLGKVENVGIKEAQLTSHLLPIKDRTLENPAKTDLERANPNASTPSLK